MAIFFVLLSATDFFDGFFARKFGTVTLFGAALDPLADKFLLYSTIISLLAAGKVHFLWAIVWIGREFFVMGIRQIALEHRLSIAVSFLAKMKTFAQDCALAVIIFNPYQHFGFEMLRWNGLELSLLLIATIFSVVSAQRYCKIFLQQCKNLEWL